MYLSRRVFVMRLLGRLSPLSGLGPNNTNIGSKKRLTSIVHISPETDNCPSCVFFWRNKNKKQ